MVRCGILVLRWCILDFYNVSFPKIGIEIKLSRIAFRVFSLEVAWYGVIIAIGFLLALIYAMKMSKVFNVDSNKLFDLIVISAISAVIGARLYYVVFYGDNFSLKEPMSIINLRQGGLAIYGAIIAGFITTVIVVRLKNLNLALVLDILCVALLIGQSIGRWGNFFNQEAYGSKTALPWGMKSEATLGVCVHPCFLYESLWCFLGFLLLHVYSLKFKKYDGQVALLYFIWYGLGRFFIEALRTDSLYFFDTDIKVSQLVSAISVIVSIILLIILRYKNKSSEKLIRSI